jgi:hypothetical protein
MHRFNTILTELPQVPNSVRWTPVTGSSLTYIFLCTEKAQHGDSVNSEKLAVHRTSTNLFHANCLYMTHVFTQRTSAVPGLKRRTFSTITSYCVLDHARRYNATTLGHHELAHDSG